MTKEPPNQPTNRGQETAMSNGNRTKVGAMLLQGCQLTWNGYLF